MMNKKIVKIILIFCVAILLSCEQNKSETQQSKSNTELLTLAQKNGCISCHRVKATVVGPSWQAIADMYREIPRERARALMTYSINKGSKGKYATWKGGEGMPPLENRVESDVIDKLVEYILELRDATK